MPSSTSLNLDRLEFLAVGKSGIVYVIDEERILKEYHSEESEIDTERRALERLGLHKNIVKHLGTLENRSILERGQSLRTVHQGTAADQNPLDIKLRWVRDAAEGMQCTHDNGIIHADIG